MIFYLTNIACFKNSSYLCSGVLNENLNEIMESNSNSSSSGLSFSGVLFIVFLVLKLTHVIDWSWWWVTAPLWIPFCIVILSVILWGIYYVKKERRSRSKLQQYLEEMKQKEQQLQK